MTPDTNDNTQALTRTSFMTVADAAARVGMHHRAIRRAIERGDLRASKVCSRIRIDPDDFRAWIDRNTINPRADAEPASKVVQPRAGLRRLLDATSTSA